MIEFENAFRCSNTWRLLGVAGAGASATPVYGQCPEVQVKGEPRLLNDGNFADFDVMAAFNAAAIEHPEQTSQAAKPDAPANFSDHLARLRTEVDQADSEAKGQLDTEHQRIRLLAKSARERALPLVSAAYEAGEAMAQAKVWPHDAWETVRRPGLLRNKEFKRLRRNAAWNASSDISVGYSDDGWHVGPVFVSPNGHVHVRRPPTKQEMSIEDFAVLGYFEWVEQHIERSADLHRVAADVCLQRFIDGVGLYLLAFR
ncbi:MAG: hypothetical protein ACT452_06375 [Microthrixaceae bacterium]